MSSTDFYLNRMLEPPVLYQALSSVFNVAIHDIELLDTMTDKFEKPFNCRVIISEDDFPCRLQLFSIDPYMSYAESYDLIAHFCELTGCVAFDFGPDKNTNPFTGTLIFKHRSYQQVLLDPTPLSRHHELYILEYGAAFAHVDDWDDDYEWTQFRPIT